MYIIKLGGFIAAAVIIALLYLPVLSVLLPWHRRLGPLMLQYASRICLMILGVRIVHADAIQSLKLKNKGVILLANHSNLLDIFILSALYRSVFVSKIEVKYYPLFGQIAWMVGTIFLKRDSARDRSRIIKTIANNSENRIIAIFPQGTTSMSSDPNPFKRGIFRTTEINHDIVLLPVTIHYREEAEIFWGDGSLFENLRNICTRKIHVKVLLHKEITIKDYSGKTIPEICNIAQEAVLSPLKLDF
jgi:1-acyl-sn-glycerol-3-phosphate acyltransferase